jgi:hypothetical protein
MLGYRHSPHCILSWTKSVMKGHTTWVMHYKPMRWETFSSHHSHIKYYDSIQTLTTLHLDMNNIDAEGAQHLAHALQTNAVRQVLLSSVTYQPLCFDTDTHHTESWVEQNRWWRGTTPRSCTTNKCGETSSLLISHVSTIMIQYRHSLHWILTATISILKGLNTWLKYYKPIRWEKFSPHQPHFDYYASIQTLTTLNLDCNNIDAEGAQHLAQALQTNAVREVLSSSVIYRLLWFNTDTHHTESWQEQYRWWRGTTSGSCITK